MPIEITKLDGEPDKYKATLIGLDLTNFLNSDVIEKISKFEKAISEDYECIITKEGIEGVEFMVGEAITIEFKAPADTKLFEIKDKLESEFDYVFKRATTPTSKPIPIPLKIGSKSAFKPIAPKAAPLTTKYETTVKPPITELKSVHVTSFQEEHTYNVAGSHDEKSELPHILVMESLPPKSKAERAVALRKFVVSYTVPEKQTDFEEVLRAKLVENKIILPDIEAKNLVGTSVRLVCTLDAGDAQTASELQSKLNYDISKHYPERKSSLDLS
jgi:hypothetical protein